MKTPQRAKLQNYCSLGERNTIKINIKISLNFQMSLGNSMFTRMKYDNLFPSDSVSVKTAKM